MPQTLGCGSCFSASVGLGLVDDNDCGRMVYGMGEKTVHRESEPASPGSATSKSNGKEVKVLDPTGFTISLTIETWERHIVRGHPELRDLMDVVATTIREPEIILELTSAYSVCFYYRLAGRTVLRRNDLFMAVVVQRDGQTKTGVVKTAYLTREIKKEGGNLVWLRRV